MWVTHRQTSPSVGTVPAGTGVVLSVAVLRVHLLAAGLAGSVATTREQSLRHHRLFAARDPRVLTGLLPDRDWNVPELLALMADRCGVDPDPAAVTGRDHIDPDRTVAGLDTFAERLATAARDRSPVLFGTGRPGPLLGFHATLAMALAGTGCPVLTPAQGRFVDMTTEFGVSRHRIRYVRGVASVHEEGARPQPGAPGVHSHPRCRCEPCSPSLSPRTAGCQNSSGETADGSARQVSSVSRRWDRPTPTIPPRSSGGPRDGSAWRVRWVTAYQQATTLPWRAMYSIAPVCHIRRPDALLFPSCITRSSTG